MQDFKVVSNWLILCLLNFESCQLWHQLSQTFFHQFRKKLCPSCWKFPEFSKAFPTFYILTILMEWPKIRKLRNQKICQFEPTLKSSLFSVPNFSTFFHPCAQRVPKWKIVHIWQSKEPKNTKKTPYNVWIICFQSFPDVLQHPVCVNVWF